MEMRVVYQDHHHHHPYALSHPPTPTPVGPRPRLPSRGPKSCPSVRESGSISVGRLAWCPAVQMFGLGELMTGD
ncbi:unnamed protein product [Merluccius merluccius]